MTRGARFISSQPSYVHGRGRVLVGNALYHSVGDRKQAVQNLVVAFDKLYTDAGHAVGVLPYEGSGERVKKNPVWYQWWISHAVPEFDAFTKFKAEQLSGDTTGPGGSYVAYGERFATDWGVYEDWQKRVKVLYDTAKLLGIPLTTPKPDELLPTTTIEDAEEVARKLAGAGAAGAKHVWDLASIAVYGGLGLLGAITAVSLVNAARNKTDPVTTWTRAYRGR